MKRIVESKEEDGLEKLLGEYVELYCLNYFYAGKLVGVGKEDVCLEECRVVYDTGRISDHSGYENSELFGTTERMVRKACIESYGLAPKLIS